MVALIPSLHDWAAAVQHRVPPAEPVDPAILHAHRQRFRDEMPLVLLERPTLVARAGEAMPTNRRFPPPHEIASASSENGRVSSSKMILRFVDYQFWASTSDLKSPMYVEGHAAA